ncbi:hypothetical protein DFH07DRAFT_264773, partial [Mycena maculata]
TIHCQTTFPHWHASGLHFPPEILIQVFLECCSGQHHPLQSSVAVAISHVSTLWRDIALSTPALWASFSLEIGQSDEIISRLLHLHLKRSAAYPLSFRVDFNQAEVSPAASTLVEALVEHSERWAIVKLPLSPTLAPLFSALSGRLSSLKSLELRLQALYDLNDGAAATFFAVAPRLRRLALGSSVPCKIPFPKNQLTELHLGAAPTLEMHQFLTLCPCPHLTRLTLTPFYPLKLPSLPQPFPPMMHLQTLVLAIRDGYSRNPVIEVLDLLAAPSLQNLEVVGIREFRLPPQAFEAFVRRSGCTLQSLTALPSLTRLVVVARGSDAMRAVGLILGSLTLQAPDDQPLLPKLVSLELQTASLHPELASMVQSRLGHDLPWCSKLKTLIVHDSPENDAARRQLRSLENGGLSISYLPRLKASKAALFI